MTSIDNMQDKATFLVWLSLGGFGSFVQVLRVSELEDEGENETKLESQTQFQWIWYRSFDSLRKNHLITLRLETSEEIGRFTIKYQILISPEGTNSWLAMLNDLISPQIRCSPRMLGSKNDLYEFFFQLKTTPNKFPNDY
jgi:hypothetical protein